MPLILIAALLASLPTPHIKAQSTVLSTEIDCLDGNQRDVAATQIAVAFPEDKRVFFAQGRRMMAHQIASRERHTDEELEYDETLTNVEYDSLNDLLFVLTKVDPTGEPGEWAMGSPTLTMYDASSTVPSELTKHVFGAPDANQPLHIRVIPEDQKLLVVRGLSVTVFRYHYDLITVELEEEVTIFLNSVTKSYLPIATCPSEPADSRQVRVLGLPAIQRAPDGSGGFVRRAFFPAGIAYTATPGLPKSKGIVALEFDSTYSLAGSAFSAHVFDPLEDSCPLDPVSFPPDLSAVSDLDIYYDSVADHWFLIAVGAKDFQLKSFRITNFPSVGFDRYQEKMSFAGGLTDTLHAVDVVADRLLILGTHYQFGVSATDFNAEYVTAERFGHGPTRDTTVILEDHVAGPTNMQWSANGLGPAPHRLMIVDADNILGPPGVPTERLWAPGNSDTSVYIPEYASVYCTNLNGLGRYDLSLPGSAIPVEESYLPADQIGSLGVLSPIEHMIAVDYDIPGSPHDWGLFGQGATGSFYHWGVDPISRDPELVEFVDGHAATPPVWPDAPTWESGDTIYGQDVTFGVSIHDANPMVVMDHYNITKNDGRLAAYDLVTQSWGVALQAPTALDVPIWDLHLATTPAGVSGLVADKQWVFGGTVGGFFVAEVVDGAGTMVLRDHRLTDTGTGIGPIGGFHFREVRGVGHFSGINDRIWVAMTDIESRDHRFAFAAYDFDPATGTIGPAPLWTLLNEPEPGAQNDYQDLYLKGASRLNAYTHGNETQIFIGTTNGHVLQVSYFENGGIAEQISTMGGRYWHNDAFFSETTDCQVVNVATPGAAPILRVCASQWTEAFAIIEPFGWF